MRKFAICQDEAQWMPFFNWYITLDGKQINQKMYSRIGARVRVWLLTR